MYVHRSLCFLTYSLRILIAYSPCRHRKVKCDHSQPCRTCRKRGHPDICVYTLSEPDDQHRASATRQSPSANRPLWNGSFGIQSVQTNPIIARDDGANEVEQLASPKIGASLRNTIAVHRSTEEDLSTITSIASNRDPNEQHYSGGTSILTQLHLLDPDSFRDIAEDAAPILGLQNTVAIDPFLDTTTPRARWNALQNILPDKMEVLTLVNASYSYIF